MWKNLLLGVGGFVFYLGLYAVKVAVLLLSVAGLAVALRAGFGLGWLAAWLSGAGLFLLLMLAWMGVESALAMGKGARSALVPAANDADGAGPEAAAVEARGANVVRFPR